MICCRGWRRMPPACIVGFQWVETARQHTRENVGRRAVPSVAQLGEQVWWMPLQPSNRRLGPLDSRFE